MFRFKGLLKPGEIATPDAEGALTALDDLSFYESLGAQNSVVMRRNFEPAIECNGNECMGQDFADAIFLSYKAGGDHKRSKGRAATRRKYRQSQNTGSSECPF